MEKLTCSRVQVYLDKPCTNQPQTTISDMIWKPCLPNRDKCAKARRIDLPDVIIDVTFDE